MDYFSLPLHRTLSTTQESARLEEEEEDRLEGDSPLDSSSSSSSSSTTSSQNSFYLHSYKNQRQGLYFPPPPLQRPPPPAQSPSFGLELESASAPIEIRGTLMNDATSSLSPTSTISSSLTLADHMDQSSFLSTSPASSSSSSSYSTSSSFDGSKETSTARPTPPLTLSANVHDISPTGPRPTMANFVLKLPPNHCRAFSKAVRASSALQRGKEEEKAVVGDVVGNQEEGRALDGRNAEMAVEAGSVKMVA